MRIKLHFPFLSYHDTCQVTEVGSLQNEIQQGHYTRDGRREQIDIRISHMLFLWESAGHVDDHLGLASKAGDPRACFLLHDNYCHLQMNRATCLEQQQLISLHAGHDTTE